MVAFADTCESEAPSGPLSFGSALAVAVEDDGAVADELLLVARVCAEKQGRATFTGYVADNETGLDYARNRMYSPTLGRFIGKDPWSYIDGFNSYESNFVPNGTDPYGLFDFDPTLPGSNAELQAQILKMLEGMAKGMNVNIPKEILEKLARIYSIKRTDYDSWLTKDGVGPGTCASPCKKVTVLVETPGVNPQGYSDDPYEPGHSGIAIGNNYYDWGPGGDPMGSPGGPLWDATLPGIPDATLADILKALPVKAHGADVFKAEICVCADGADAVEKYWKDKYSKGGSYSPAGDHCSSTVGQSLAGTSHCGVAQPGVSGASTLVLLYELKALMHTCGENKGQKIKLEKIQSRAATP